MKRKMMGAALSILIMLPNVSSAATFEAMPANIWTEIRTGQRSLLHRVSTEHDDLFSRLNQARAALIESVDPGIVQIQVRGTRSEPPSETAKRQQDMARFQQFLIDENREKFLKNNPGASLPPSRPQSGEPSGRPSSGMGSGVIVGREPDGSLLIVTNAHVVSMNDKGGTVRILTFGQQPKTGTILDYNLAFDLALVKMNEPCLECKVLELADDKEDLRKGYIVLALGSPYGFGETATWGAISNSKRTSIPGGPGGVEYYLQTDAAINKGNSGGALVNAATKKVIGINTAIMSPNGGSIGIAFTVPSQYVIALIQRYRATGAISAARLGAGVGFDEDASAVVLGKILPGSAAFAAGLELGDVIVKVVSGGQTYRDFKSPTDFSRTVANLVPNQPATFTVRRGFQVLNLKVVLKEYK